MSKTDLIKRAVNCELERRRKEIDGAKDLRSVSMILVIPRGKQNEVKVIYRTEEESVFAPVS